ncbi:ureidoglycolate lyase [Alcaligenaceae bacterium]|nr:ureidoglycolate lyase [Alcaligenaceae bacterium]
MRLHPERLAGNVFEPYGEVIEHAGDAARHPVRIPFEVSRSDVRFGMTVNRLKHCADPVVHVDVLERHPHSPQSFIPLGGATRSLIVVARSADDGTLDLSTLRAFICAPGQGVVYRLAVWHYAFTSIDDNAEVAVILGRTGQDDDTEYTRLRAPVQVILEKAGS